MDFAGRKNPDVGVSLDVQLVDHVSYMPAQISDEICSSIPHNSDMFGKIKPGLYKSLLQLETGLYPSINDMKQELYRVMDYLKQLCFKKGVLPLISGSHPFSDWKHLKISSLPRYQAFVKRLQWVGYRAAIYGFRMFIGVPDGEKAIVLVNSITSLNPLFLALTASSPFWMGLDTGLASCRTRIIDNIPNAGIPPKLLNYGEFRAYVKTLQAAESISGISEIWWDARPHLRKGVLELQVCDMPHTLKEIVAVTALAQSVVVKTLQMYEEGEEIPSHDLWINRENKWRATRFGTSAQIVGDSSGSLISMRKWFDNLILWLDPVLIDLNLKSYMHTIDEIFTYGPGYIRQRHIARKFSINQIIPSILTEFSNNEIIPPSC